MSAENIIHALLAAATAVTAVVSDRIYPGELPQGTAMPALGVSHISTIERPTINAGSAYTMVQTRIEVTVLSKDYVTLKNLVRLVRAACNYQRGVFATYTVISVMQELIGPDMRDSDLTVFSQTIDFNVTWQQANP